MSIFVHHILKWLFPTKGLFDTISEACVSPNGLKYSYIYICEYTIIKLTIITNQSEVTFSLFINTLYNNKFIYKS